MFVHAKFRQCMDCGDVVPAGQPCWCIFDEGVVPTLIPVDGNVFEMSELVKEANCQFRFAAALKAEYEEVDEHAWELLPC